MCCATAMSRFCLKHYLYKAVICEFIHALSVDGAERSQERIPKQHQHLCVKGDSHRLFHWAGEGEEMHLLGSYEDVAQS